MEYKWEIKKGIFGLLMLSSLATLINVVADIAVIWYVIDTLYFIIPTMFLLVYAKSLENGLVIATALYVPAIMVLFMVLNGLFFVDTPIWDVINVYQVFIYTYTAGRIRQKVSS